MASVNPYDLLNDDAQDQEIRIPAVKKESKPVAAKPTPASTGGASKAATGNQGPRKDGARTGNTRPPRDINND
ncbi:hypothetical protein BGZ83_001088, partial [Gryganskiella cystojenkinii]